MICVFDCYRADVFTCLFILGPGARSSVVKVSPEPITLHVKLGLPGLLFPIGIALCLCTLNCAVTEAFQSFFSLQPHHIVSNFVTPLITSFSRSLTNRLSSVCQRGPCRTPCVTFPYCLVLEQLGDAGNRRTLNSQLKIYGLFFKENIINSARIASLCVRAGFAWLPLTCTILLFLNICRTLRWCQAVLRGSRDVLKLVSYVQLARKGFFFSKCAFVFQSTFTQISKGLELRIS